MQSVEINDLTLEDAFVAHCWELGTTGIIQSFDSVEAFFPGGTDLTALTTTYNAKVRVASECPSGIEPLKSEAIDPILAGDRFFIVSASSLVFSVSNRTRIEIDAQNAFGSGSHESTQLVIRALETYIRPDTVVIDVGSGSGILSAVAQHLGAAKSFACDTHFDSVLLTRQHAPNVHAFFGSIDAISSHTADIVIANISSRVIDQLSQHLSNITKPEGWLILAGFIADNPPQFFQPAFETGMGEWRCWVCKPHSCKDGQGAILPFTLQPFASEWW